LNNANSITVDNLDTIYLLLTPTDGTALSIFTADLVTGVISKKQVYQEGDLTGNVVGL